MGDAVKAMIGWCNEQGGINGRQIVGHQYDAAMTNAAAVMQKSCKSDFMLVGQGFAYDEAAEQFRVGCDLPTVAGFVIGPNASMGPDKFEPIPLPAGLLQRCQPRHGDGGLPRVQGEGDRARLDLSAPSSRVSPRSSTCWARWAPTSWTAASR